MASDPFVRIVSSLDGPMLIVTAASNGERSGCLVGFHTQCSIEPRRWIACISKRNHTHRIAEQASSLALHVLRADQYALAALFGDETCDMVDKFARCAWHPRADGTPILTGCDWISGRVTARIDCGDHTAMLLDVVDGAQEHPGGPALGFQSVRGMTPGHPP